MTSTMSELIGLSRAQFIATHELQAGFEGFAVLHSQIYFSLSSQQFLVFALGPATVLNRSPLVPTYFKLTDRYI